MVNEKFGNWTTTKEPFRKSNYRLYCMAKCVCGKEKLMDYQSLKRGKTNSCGCKRKTRLVDIVGKKFGMLTVISKQGKSPSGMRWNCKCDCGEEIVATGKPLKSGITKSCGCYRAETVFGRSDFIRGSQSITHGLSGKSIYRTHVGMMARCYNKKSTSFKNYGARGISVCKRWHNLMGFLEDMGHPPKGHSIERIDNDGNYCPDNCKWATAKEQANNRRLRKSITHNGVTRTYLAWSLYLGGNHTLISKRITRGWSEELAVTTAARCYPKKCF